MPDRRCTSTPISPTSTQKLDRRARPPGPDGDHRRRVLDGRRDREAARPAGALPQARGGADGGRLPRHRRARRQRPGHRRALRHGRRDRHHHLDAGQGAGRRGGRVRRGLGGGLRLPHPAGPAPALLQRAPAHRRGELARQHRVPRGPSGAGDPPARATPATSASSSSSSASSRSRARPRSSPSSWARPPPPSG